MLNRTRRKFILWAMAAMFVIVAVLIAAVNIVNRVQTERRLDAALHDIAASMSDRMTGESQMPPDSFGAEGQTGEEFGSGGFGAADETGEEFGNGGFGAAEEAGEEFGGGSFGPPADPGERGRSADRRRSALVQYGSRYFFVAVDAEGLIERVFQEELISEESAQALVDEILQSGKPEGTVRDYRYMIVNESPAGRLLCFLDCAMDLDATRSLRMISLIVGAVGLVLAFLFILKMSRIAVEPVRISIEKQKQFITNAGHELKTPLTAISANMDILSMDLGDNEWVTGTRRQVRRMRKLVENMTTLSRIEEDDRDLIMQAVSLSDVAKECADTFSSVAQIRGIALESAVEEELMIRGDRGLIEQLLTILCDNAVKYAAGEEPVRVRAYRDGKHAVFETRNAWAQDIAADRLDDLFERFYRGDPARSGPDKSSGYGLGLSIAQAIAQKNHAELTVSQDEAHRIIFRARFRHQEEP